MNVHFRVSIAVATALGLAACASEPLGPTVQVMPGANKPFEAFQGDQAACKQYASQQVAGQVDRANERGVGEAAIATGLGVALGAAIGGGRGAGIGAAGGAIVGADVGSGTSSRADHSIQHQYNLAYTQCMYAKGDQVVQPPPRVYYAPPPVVYYPPPVVYQAPPPAYGPPPGYPPPPAYPPPQ